MINATLTRHTTSPEGTFGTLEIGGQKFATVERPDLDNAPEVSCIPAGDYICEWTFSNRLQRETYQIMNVPDRTGIRFHPANVQSELLGCIAPGLSVVEINGVKAVIGSKAAMGRIDDLGGKEKIMLKILDEYSETGIGHEPVA